MKATVLGLGILLIPTMTWAGGAVSAARPAPVLDESGLVMLALGLAGTGLALLRRHK